LGVVQRAGFSEELVVLRLRVPGQTRYLLLRPTAAGYEVGLVSADDKPAAFEGKLPPGCASIVAAEDALDGASVLAVSARGVLCSAPARQGAVAEGAAAAPPVLLRIVVRAGRLALVRGENPTDPGSLLDEAELRSRGLVMLTGVRDAGLLAARNDALRRLKVATTKLERRLRAVSADLVKMDDARELIDAAQWLVGLAHKAKRGTKVLGYTDWSTGVAVERTLPLDPARSPKEQVEAMFRRAKRLKLGRVHAERRRDDCARALGVLAQASARAQSNACTFEDLAALQREAKAAAPKEFSLNATDGARASAGAARSASRSASTSRDKGPSYRVFVSGTGTSIFVGKGSTSNDELTFRVAKPHDLFLHAKGATGAHVIVPLARNQTCNAETLVEAAMLAAHFSAARDELFTDVTYVPRKFVRKPRGAAPGQVLLEREKVLALRVDPERLRALLEREAL